MPRHVRLLLAAAALVAVALVVFAIRQSFAPSAAEETGQLSDLGLLLEDSGGSPYVLAVRDHSPAMRAGFSPHDRLLAINGTTLETVGQMEQAFSQLTCTGPLTFLVLRDGVEMTLTLTPRRKRP